MRTPDQIMDSLSRKCDRILGACAAHFEEKVRQTLSVHAPTTAVLGRDGRIYIRATTPATPGAPPRIVSLNLVLHVDTHANVSLGGTDTIYQVGVWNVPYAARLELEMNHEYLMPTVRNELSSLRDLVARMSHGD